MQQRIITIIGGTGFVGRYAVKLLAAEGYRLRIISRNPASALHLKTAGDVGQIALLPGDLAQPWTLAGSLDNSYAVINLAGILFEGGSQRFDRLHAQGAEKLAQMSKAAGVERFIHVSSLGVDKATGSQYARSKMLGEKAVMAAFPEATILRPGVIFGPEDNFFNRFAQIATLFSALPLIGGGTNRFQPVYAGDVAKAIAACLTLDSAPGQLYELGGPQAYSFRQLMEYVFQTIEHKPRFIPLPFSVAPLAALATALPGLIFPVVKLSADQVKLLKHDNIVSPNSKGLAALGIAPVGIEVIVPDYLARFRAQATEQRLPV